MVWLGGFLWVFRRSSSNAGFLREGLRTMEWFVNRLGGPHDYHCETTTCEVPFGKKTNIAMMEYHPFLNRKYIFISGSISHYEITKVFTFHLSEVRFSSLKIWESMHSPCCGIFLVVCVKSRSSYGIIRSLKFMWFNYCFSNFFYFFVGSTNTS